MHLILYLKLQNILKRKYWIPLLAPHLCHMTSSKNRYHKGQCMWKVLLVRVCVFNAITFKERQSPERQTQTWQRTDGPRNSRCRTHTHTTHTGRNKTLYRNIIKTTDKHKQRVYYVNIINVISEVSTPYQVPHSEDKPRDGDSDGWWKVKE